MHNVGIASLFVHAQTLEAKSGMQSALEQEQWRRRFAAIRSCLFVPSQTYENQSTG